VTLIGDKVLVLMQNEMKAEGNIYKTYRITDFTLRVSGRKVTL